MSVFVLVVEDQPSDRAIVEKALLGLELDLLSASTAEEALAMVAAHDIALILLDVHLPDGSGGDLAAALHANEATRYIPIIFVTSEQDPEALLRYEAEAIDCLSKPVNPVVLRSKVRLFCELQRQREVIEDQLGTLQQQKRQLQEAVQEREQAEEALQESEVRYRALLELSPVATVVQANDEVLYVNTAVLDLVGAHSREELLGTSILAFFTADTLDAGKQYVEQLVRQGGRLAPMEAEWRRRDGSHITVQVSGACILYGGQIGVQFAIVDISERKRLEHELHVLSRRDALTLVHNRRSFDEELERACRTARRNDVPVALLLLDIDAFKPYNDHYGHQQGDAVLQRVAQTLEQESHRAGDHVARYGGEEFAVILPETNLRGARTVAERIRSRVEALGIVHEGSPVAKVLTVSIGVAQRPRGQEVFPEQLLQAADKALYQAKHAGRNAIFALQL